MGKDKTGGKWGKGGGIDPANIVNRSSLISERESKQKLVDETLKVFRDMNDQYGSVVDEVELATIKGKDSTAMAYCDGTNIGVNRSYFSDRMETAYDECVKAGFHPGRGDKTAVEAVIAHEFGHKLSADIGRLIGTQQARGSSGIFVDYTSSGADYVMREAMKSLKGTGIRGVHQLAASISGYAKQSKAETVAEAVADVYCNGAKAKRGSKAIVDVINKVLKK